MKIIVTGHLGFIGAEFVKYLFKVEPDTEIIGLDKQTYAGSLARLGDINYYPKFKDVYHDIARPLKDIDWREVGAVVNFAAESHVDRSIAGNTTFIDSNIVGVQQLLDAVADARQLVGRNITFLQVSTDEVYGSIPYGHATEDFAIKPSNPYSATKASAEHLCMAAHNTHGLDVRITRGANTMGPFQHPEKFIPNMVKHAMAGQPLPVYGTGQQHRTWIYLDDHVKGIYTVLKKGRAGEVYNVGTLATRMNSDIAGNILYYVDNREATIKFVQDRKGHDFRYAINSEKLQALGWKPEYDFKKGLMKTVEWYVQNQWWFEHMEQKR